MDINILSNLFMIFILDKTKEIWWKKLLQHEPNIDATKIDVSRPMDELSEQTQAYLNKIQFDEQQKLKGT